jgi:Clostripain family
MTQKKATVSKAGRTTRKPQSGPAEWTVMVYMAGDNNLSRDCVNSIKAMKSIKTGDKIHVIAQFDPGDPRVSTRRMVLNLASKKGSAVRALLKKKNQIGSLDDDRVFVEPGKMKFGRRPRRRMAVPHQPGVFETDTADPTTLFDFISWSKENFKAKRYMLILSGHSSGVEDGFLLKDEHPLQTMKLDALKNVLIAVRKKLKMKLDIIGMDACLMSMVEICYEFRGLAKVLVGSQSLGPSTGWPYDQIIEAMMNGPQRKAAGRVEAEELGPVIVDRFIGSYVDQAINSGVSTDLSALNIDGATDVATAVRELAGALSRGLTDSALNTIFKPALVLAHWEAQSYNGELFVDLSDFCNLLIPHLRAARPDQEIATKATTMIDAVMKACENVQQAIRKMVLASCFCGIDYQFSNGISIYFPWSTIFFDYSKLGFAEKQGANWNNFLEDYVEQTRRQPRFGSPLRDGRVEQFFVLLDPEVSSRRVQPLDHGPDDAANSMRNPPRSLSRYKIRSCV